MKSFANLLLVFPLLLPAVCSQPNDLASLLRSPNGCFDDINCPPGSHCLGGRCVFQGMCSGDVDCGPGRRCVGGTCH